MSAGSLIKHIQDKQLDYLSIIGLAKNAGKTVTLNTVVSEARESGLNLALVSYGRDGEEIDAITGRKKPPIYIPPGDLFITGEKAYKNSSLTAGIYAETGIETLMGPVNIYQNGESGGYIELVGVNSVRRLKKVLALVSGAVDLTLIDGALDRRSSVLPSIVDGFILATGAVVGNSEDSVIEKTVFAVRRLTLPPLEDQRILKYAEQLYNRHRSGVIDKEENLLPFKGITTYGNLKRIKEVRAGDIGTIILDGALLDSFIEDLIFKSGVCNITLVVRDGTRVFLNKRNLNLLTKYYIDLRVYNSADLIAVTVNPETPYGISLDSGTLVSGIKRRLDGIPVYDVLGEEYRNSTTMIY